MPQWRNTHWDTWNGYSEFAISLKACPRLPWLETVTAELAYPIAFAPV
jgi:hypothetical protein